MAQLFIPKKIKSIQREYTFEGVLSFSVVVFNLDFEGDKILFKIWSGLFRFQFKDLLTSLPYWNCFSYFTHRPINGDRLYRLGSIF